MSDDASPRNPDLPASVDSQVEAPAPAETSGTLESTSANGTKAAGAEDVVLDDAPVNDTASGVANEQPPTENAPEASSTALADDKAADDENIKDSSNDKDELTGQGEDTPTDALADTPASKSKGARRRSAVPEHKRKLNKKASKAKITHTDAKPGDYFYARLKGFPPWPVIICDEDMLPQTLLKTRPVTAAQGNGEYRDAYKDGGPKVKDRSFPVMYLYTNEFSWTVNTDLNDLDFETVGTFSGKMRKDLQEAHKLAEEQNPLSYFKDVLRNFQEQRKADLQAAQEAKEAKAAKAAAAKEKKAKSAKVVSDEDGDVEMDDVDGGETASVQKKRKSEDDNRPPESSKKIKLNLKLTPKTPNGNATPKAAKDTPVNGSAKPKAKKATPKASEPTEAAAPKEPELSAEEKYKKKEKEILFLRHKLQKGLLSRDQAPKEEEMKQMSEFINKLEGYSQLEVSIIRATKINKVLKNIIKLPAIPKEDEFKFKTRSQVLLDKWNKLLASEQVTTSAAPAATATSGNTTTEAKIEGDDGKTSTPDITNGAQDIIDRGEKQDEDKFGNVESSDTKEVANASIEEIPVAPKDPSEIPPGSAVEGTTA